MTTQESSTVQPDTSGLRPGKSSATGAVTLLQLEQAKVGRGVLLETLLDDLLAQVPNPELIVLRVESCGFWGTRE